ncbi:prephenate dehydrogenase [Virgibacillus necropolis]|uniref:Prephenate dehydrogenase n=1 Tax=Virgibacillus necropolis TaxID=163877 RepID=A0A221MEJ1_9BACI|nr:prephenate dehydrogenase [Virgibacillus necropolis]ASN06061.1 prephenate dehydrogenase [Virgibacillus necropolis]
MSGNVFIVGLGLIGGSLALTIKNQHPHAKIYGYDVKQSEIETASALNIIDEKVTSFHEGAELADLIILSTPVLEMEKLMKQLSSLTLKENVIITDTGSTKGGIMQLASKLLQKEVTFIGGHPMAGSHKAGVESAKVHLFENAFYVLTPQLSTSSEKVEELKDWLSGANSHFLVLDTEEHDYITGVVSHFPHVIAAGLVNLAKKNADKNPLISLLAAGGFRDVTRIASSNPNMWKDIVKQNRLNLLDLIEDWMMEMRNIQNVLAEEDEHAIIRFFEEAKEFRDSLPVHSKGAIPSYYDLYVDVKDVPGAIAGITSLLAKQSISITNLHILESREGLLGVLRISFQKDEDRSKAQVLLNHNNFKTYEAA